MPQTVINAWHRPFFQCASKHTRGRGPLASRESMHRAGGWFKKKKVPIDRAHGGLVMLNVYNSMTAAVIQEKSRGRTRRRAIGLRGGA
jgi:hypothetical protein